jgi:molybdopterin-binding protein
VTHSGASGNDERFAVRTQRVSRSSSLLSVAEGSPRNSARNQIPAKVTAVTHGEATANVELDANGVRLVASITTEAARELGLADGSEVIAIVKASDVTLGVRD